MCKRTSSRACGHLFAGDVACPCFPTQQYFSDRHREKRDRSSHASLAARETDAFAADATDGARSRAAPTRDRDSPASREVASIPMRIWLGGASNRLSFSSQTCQPSLALAKVIGLTTTLLSGRQIQPAQDWLPISTPQTYLIVASRGGKRMIQSYSWHTCFR
jgi:hypothetical protein